MTTQNLANILIGLALVGWIVYRQLTWRIVSIPKMWKKPLILGAVGIVTLSQAKNVHQITALDLGVLVIELVISLAIGAVMGKIAVFRPRNIRPGDTGGALVGRLGDRRGRRRPERNEVERQLNADGTETVVETRTGWWVIALWIVMILVRIGIDVVATQMGSVLAAATGVILITVAANGLARVFVFAARVQKSATVTAMMVL